MRGVRRSLRHRPRAHARQRRWRCAAVPRSARPRARARLRARCMRVGRTDRICSVAPVSRASSIATSSASWAGWLPSVAIRMVFTEPSSVSLELVPGVRRASRGGGAAPSGDSRHLSADSPQIRRRLRESRREGARARRRAESDAERLKCDDRESRDGSGRKGDDADRDIRDDRRVRHRCARRRPRRRRSRAARGRAGRSRRDRRSACPARCRRSPRSRPARRVCGRRQPGEGRGLW